MGAEEKSSIACPHSTREGRGNGVGKPRVRRALGAPLAWRTSAATTDNRLDSRLQPGLDLLAQRRDVGAELNEVAEMQASDKASRDVRPAGLGASAQQPARQQKRFTCGDPKLARELARQEQILDEEHRNPPLHTLTSRRYRVRPDTQEQIVESLLFKPQNVSCSPGRDGAQNILASEDIRSYCILCRCARYIELSGK